MIMSQVSVKSNEDLELSALTHCDFFFFNTFSSLGAVWKKSVSFTQTCPLHLCPLFTAPVSVFALLFPVLTLPNQLVKSR